MTEPAKPHIYRHRGRWTVAGNADVPWEDNRTATEWCRAMNVRARKRAINAFILRQQRAQLRLIGRPTRIR